MFDFIQNFIYSILAIQENILKKKLRRNFKATYSNSTTKKAFSSGASLELTSETEQNKKKLENNVKVIVKKYENNPQKLLDFAEKNGTRVYKIPYADIILKSAGYEEGFISTIKGFKGLYLNIIIPILAKEKIKLSFNTSPMFVLRDLPLDSYSTIHHFYKWYAMKFNLPGFDAESQENFQKFLTTSKEDEKIKELSIEEILGLKEAIARDVEAINFIVDLAKSSECSKNALKKVSAGGASI